MNQMIAIKAKLLQKGGREKSKLMMEKNSLSTLTLVTLLAQ